MPLALFLGIWLYVWFQVEPPLRYHRSAPVFLLRTDFLADHLRHPGGLVEYAGAWLAQLDCRAPLGALATALLIGLVAAGFRRVLFWAGARTSVLVLVPALLLLVLAGQYDFPVANTGLGLAVAVWGMAAWQAWRPDRVFVRGAVLAAVSALLCHVAGHVSALLFVGLASVWEGRTPPRVRAAMGGLAALAGVGAVVLFSAVSMAALLPSWGRGVPLVSAVLLHLFLPVAMGWLCRGPAPGTAAEVGPATPVGRHPVMARDRHLLGGLGAPWWTVGVLAAAGVLAWTFDSERRAVTRIEWNVQEGRWEQALRTARRLQARPGPATRLAIHRALFHRGRLTEALFAFPQQRGTDLLPTLRDGLRVCAPLSDTLIELGQVNLAEHFAHEALETLGERPHLLWQLARINVLLNRPRAARVFLERLRQVPFHRAKAERRLRALEADPSLAAEPDVARVRPLLATSDLADSGLPTDLLLRQLLQSNHRNRMAYEYLLAHYLLTDQPEAIVEQLGALEEFGFWQTPRLVEEALVVHLAATRAAEPAVGGRRVSPDTVRRHREFQARLSQMGGRGVGVEGQLAREFGDTYWFYRVFGATFGAATAAFTTTREGDSP